MRRLDQVMITVKDLNMKVYISEKLIKFFKRIWQHLRQKAKTDGVTGAQIFKMADSNGVK